MSTFLWKIGGEAGFGIMSVGLTFSKLAVKSGYHIFDYDEYPSLIRGGHNTYEVNISSEQVSASKEHIDLLICLNKATYEIHKRRLGADSMVVYDPEEFAVQDDVRRIAIPFRKFRKELKLMQVMVNTIALGTTFALLDGNLQFLFAAIEKEFAKKSEQVREFNKKLAQMGYDYVVEHYLEYCKNILSKRNDGEKVVMAGNDAFALGSVIADCRLYVAYPMTPASSILSTMADWQFKTGIVVKHAEDEISVINMALGASFAGVRSAVGTSGGGFALMVEGISFAGVAEIPVVILLGMRPGPATGMPSWTEQGDLLFAAHAGHGEFPKIVLAPGDVEEMLELTVAAFDLADIYQTPVIIVSDKVLCESHSSLPKDKIHSLTSNYHPNRGNTVTSTTERPYLRYRTTPDGISDRLIPGYKGAFYQANSYEHTPDSHTTEDSQERIEQVNKRNRKAHTYLNAHFKAPRVYGNLEESQTVFVSWGGNKGAVLEAQKILKTQGHQTAFLHFTHVFPLNKEKVLPFFKSGKRYIMVENNSHAQFSQLLRQQTGITITEHILKYDGRPLFPAEISHYITSSVI